MTSALIVEDGTIKAGANAYIDVTYANTYHAARKNTAWTGTVADKEGAIIRATDYMTQMYRQRWKGTLKSAQQALDWPRAYVYTLPFVIGGAATNPELVPDNIVPDRVKAACAELCLRALTLTLWEDATRDVSSETVGPISVTYASYTQSRTRTYPQVDAMLAEFLTGYGDAMMKVERS